MIVKLTKKYTGTQASQGKEEQKKKNKISHKKTVQQGYKHNNYFVAQNIGVIFYAKRAFLFCSTVALLRKVALQ